MGACGGWLRDHSQALDPRRGQSTQGQGYSSYWSACVDVSDAAECWAHADAPQAGYGGSLAVFDSADYYGDATFCCGGRDNPPCDSPGGVYGEIGNFGTPEYLAAVSEYVPCTPVGPIGSSGSDETGCRNNGGDGTPAEYGCMGCGPARWQRRQERFRQGYIDFIIAAWDDAFGSQRNEEEPRKTWMPGDPPPPPPTSWFDSPSCFPQPAGPEWWREADPWYGLCVFKWNVFGGFQGYSVPVCSRDAFFRGECFAMEWRGSGSLTTWSSKNTGSPPYMPSWHCGVDPVSGEGGCFHEDPRIVGYGYFNQALAEEGGPWADGTVYQGEFCNGWCQPTMIGTWWPPTKVTHPFGDKADCEGNNTNLSHHGTGGCGNAELYLCESWHQPDGKCVDVTPRRNHWVRGKWVVDDPMPAEECPPEPSGCDTRNATSLEECEKALPACGFVYVSPKQWSCVEPEPGEGKRCVEVPAGEGESGETYYQSLKTCEEDCKNECAIEKTFQIKKGQTYVIEVDTNSVDKFNHKNHWWEIGFYKKTTETKTTGGGLGCWCSGGGQQVDPITGLPTGEPSWACTAGSGVWPMWHYDTLEKCENDCTAEFHEECVISEPLETEVTVYNPAWNISTESVTNCGSEPEPEPEGDGYNCWGGNAEGWHCRLGLRILEPWPASHIIGYGVWNTSEECLDACVACDPARSDHVCL